MVFYVDIRGFVGLFFRDYQCPVAWEYWEHGQIGRWCRVTSKLDLKNLALAGFFIGIYLLGEARFNLCCSRTILSVGISNSIEGGRVLMQSQQMCLISVLSWVWCLTGVASKIERLWQRVWIIRAECLSEVATEIEQWSMNKWGMSLKTLHQVASSETTPYPKAFHPLRLYHFIAFWWR